MCQCSIAWKREAPVTQAKTPVSNREATTGHEGKIYIPRPVGKWLLEGHSFWFASQIGN